MIHPPSDQAKPNLASISKIMIMKKKKPKERSCIKKMVMTFTDEMTTIVIKIMTIVQLH